MVNSSIVDGTGVPQDASDVSGGSVVTRWLGVTAVVNGEHSVKHAARGEASGLPPGEGKSITFRASIESEDRAGDVIKAEGWELDNYRQNPVVLWAHRHDLLPIGKSVDIWVESG